MTDAPWDPRSNLVEGLRRGTVCSFEGCGETEGLERVESVVNMEPYGGEREARVETLVCPRHRRSLSVEIRPGDLSA